MPGNKPTPTQPAESLGYLSFKWFRYVHPDLEGREDEVWTLTRGYPEGTSPETHEAMWFTHSGAPHFGGMNPSRKCLIRSRTDPQKVRRTPKDLAEALFVLMDARSELAQAKRAVQDYTGVHQPEDYYKYEQARYDDAADKYEDAVRVSCKGGKP